MEFAKNKLKDLDPSVVLSVQLCAPARQRNVLTVYSSGRATFQPTLGPEEEVQLLDDDDDTIGSSSLCCEAYLRRHLPMDAFLGLQSPPNRSSHHYYEIPSKRSCGTAANLFLRCTRESEGGDVKQEQWLGVWNYGQGDIPPSVDANMYKAVLKFVDYLMEG